VLLLAAGRVVAQGAPEQALTPETLERAYGRKARLERIGENFVAIFER
jgi:ABC-type hemin transport system ATPase subunit